ATLSLSFSFFLAPPPPVTYTLSLHDALPISAVVVGCIDEDKARGMAVTRERKLEVAERSYRLLTEKYGVAGEDIIFDALVFPVGDRKSTRLNSSHRTISYAVFCLKKKNHKVY